MMKSLTLGVGAALLCLLMGCSTTNTGNAMDDGSVAAAAEKLRLAMVAPTRDALDAVVAEELTYGHSGGKVDTKASFTADLISGKSKFTSIAISDQSVRMAGPDLALMRHTFNADTLDGGTPGKVSLKILTVWQKQAGQWKLVARQAVRNT